MKNFKGMKITMLIMLVSLAPVSVYANNDLDGVENLTQANFELFADNLASAVSYKSLSPAEPLGILGFDVSIAISATTIDETLFNIASNGGWDLEYLPMPKLMVHKGLPFNFDVGAFYTSAPDTDIKIWGAELKYSFVDGGLITPALAFRLTYSSLEGLDELEQDNIGAEVSISKGFAILTPYAGLGTVRSTATPNIPLPANVNNLQEVSTTNTKVFAGLNINVGLNIGLEVDRTGDETTYSLKTGFRF